MITMTRLAAFFLCILAPASALAQLDTGSIVGTVRDAQGAVMPGVTITVTQDGTGVATSVVTDARGQYLVPNLRIGTYTVAAELQGFRRAVRGGLPLNVQSRLEIDFALEVGSLAEEVVVTGRAELLNTQKADIGNVVDERQVKDLPLLGRRYAELAFLTPGVVAAPAGVTTRGEDTFFNVNGNMSTWNNFILDGADNNSFSTNLQERSPQVIQPPVDALQEFRVQTRTYSAEFGKAAGAVINASIKQGTNEFHGSAYEFFRDEAFNANRWENNRLNLPKNAFNQHIAGGTLGGPLVQGKAFFFGSYQAQRLDRELTQQATVPTPLMLQGNLSELTGTMRDTAFAPGCVDAATKIVNRACFDPVAAALLQYYPAANIPAALAALGRPGGFVSPNYVMTGMLANDVDQFDLRSDVNLNANNQIFGRYSFQDTTRHEPPVLGPIGSGDFNSDIFNRGQSAVGGWSRVIGNSMFNEFRASWNRISSSSLHPAFGEDVNGQVGLGGVPEDPRYSGGLPHINITRFTRLGGPFFRPQFQTSQVFQFTDNFTWNRGSHAFKFGVEKRRDLVDYIDARALNGTLSFTDGRYTNYAYADFLLGLASTEGLTLFFEPELFTDSWQFYGQDQWRATSDLTLSYGVRYEYFTPLFERQNRMTNIDPATGQVLNGSDGSAFDRGLVHPDRNNIAPRVGVAWTMTPRLVWRGGYGVFYQATDRYGSESQLAMNPPQLVDVNILANSAADPPAMILRNGFVPVSAANINPALVQWRIQDPDQVTPWVQQFSLGPEYEISSSMVGAIEYVGNVTRNGRKLRNLNQGRLQNGVAVFPFQNTPFQRAYLEQIATDGRGDFHSLQARLQKRMSRGLAFTASFTWGKALGNFLDHLSADGGGESGNFPKDAYNPDADYGPLAFDVRKRFVASFIYEVPVGRGRAADPGGALGIIASDWNVNGILTLSDGRPFSITATDLSGAGAGRISRANCLGEAMPDGFDPSVDAWFDITAFGPTAAGTFGTCGPNTVTGPGQKTMNLSFFRSVPFGDAKRLELRWEIFNVFNTPILGRPGQSVSNSATFGRITTTAGEPREMQFAVKFYF
jgi:hypothetical protein